MALVLIASSVAKGANPSVVVSIFQEMSAYIKAADTEKLAQHFDTGIELQLIDVEKTCTASQAGKLLKDFFELHKPLSYSTLHVGGKNDKHYGIGLLITSHERFRITVFLQVNDKDYTIQQLRIENDH